jgi:hypothetical protein
MSISDRVYLARAAGKLFFSISYILDIMSASVFFNVCFCIAAIQFLHVLETKKPRSFILGASCKQIVDIFYNTNPLKSAHCGRPLNVSEMGL